MDALVFRLEICGDSIDGVNPNCRVTRNMKIYNWELSNRDRESENEDILWNDIYENKCVYTSTSPLDGGADWANLHDHNSYEDWDRVSVWPGGSYVKKYLGNMCGKNAQRVSQGKDVFCQNFLQYLLHS